MEADLKPQIRSVDDAPADNRRGGDVRTLLSPKSVGSTSGFGGVATIGASLVAPFVWQPIQTGDLWAFVVMGVLGTMAQALLIRAFSLAEAAAVAPFGYTGLIWAGLWGWLFFGAVPDRWTVLGATIIVAAGLYVWTREARAMRDADRR